MGAIKPVIRFEAADVRLSLSGRLKLKKFLINQSLEEGKSLGELTYVFCSDAFLQRINSQFLKHEDLTDIITFDLSEGKGEIVGEIYISTERVSENAQLFKTDFSSELHRVMFHGFLHLMGFNDKSDPDRQVMREKEDEYLGKYGI